MKGSFKTVTSRVSLGGQGDKATEQSLVQWEQKLLKVTQSSGKTRKIRIIYLLGWKWGTHIVSPLCSRIHSKWWNDLLHITHRVEYRSHMLIIHSVQCNIYWATYCVLTTRNFEMHQVPFWACPGTVSPQIHSLLSPWLCSISQGDDYLGFLCHMASAHRRHWGRP